MTVRVECPCGWFQDVEVRPAARTSLNQILAEHARVHLSKGEPYQIPRVTFDG